MESSAGKKTTVGEEIMKKPLHIEISQKASSTSKKTEILKYISESWLPELIVTRSSSNGLFRTKRQIEVSGDNFLSEHVDNIHVCSHDSNEKEEIDLNESETVVQYYIYQMDSSGPQIEQLEGEENVSSATHWMLPSSDFHGLWDSLVYDTAIKDELLNFAMSAMLFSDKGVHEQVVGLNRVILLHGPPGTGKTSLCKALAHKLSVRLSSRFNFGQLIEINSHSLFSKWFSESGKLVMRMFSRIHELVENPQALVCVLIDEVESLAHARAGGQGGTEPSDSLRAVNALLTQIDTIKRFPNVLILTTSNITNSIDIAFVDRADIKKYVGFPTPNALYKIYHSCLIELMRVGIISPKEKIASLRNVQQKEVEAELFYPHSKKLMEIAKLSEGISGRTARKIPFLAHANYIQCNETTLSDFLEAMEKAVKKEFEERSLLTDVVNS